MHALTKLPIKLILDVALLIYRTEQVLKTPKLLARQHLTSPLTTDPRVLPLVKVMVPRNLDMTPLSVGEQRLFIPYIPLINPLPLPIKWSPKLQETGETALPLVPTWVQKLLILIRAIFLLQQPPVEVWTRLILLSRIACPVTIVGLKTMGSTLVINRLIARFLCSGSVEELTRET